MSPTRRRVAGFTTLLVAALATGFAIRLALSDGTEPARLVLASAGAACFAGVALYGVWTLWRLRRGTDLAD